MEVGKNIGLALLAVQRELPKVGKNTVNTYFNSKYADLEAVADIVIPLLNKYGIAVIQPVSGSGAVTTVLIHTDSGETLESTVELRPDKDTPQGRGSAITYARRYSLAAFVGLVTADDDGEAAMGRGKSRPAASDELLAQIKNTNNMNDLRTIRDTIVHTVDRESVRRKILASALQQKAKELQTETTDG